MRVSRVLTSVFVVNTIAFVSIDAKIPSQSERSRLGQRRFLPRVRSSTRLSTILTELQFDFSVVEVQASSRKASECL